MIGTQESDCFSHFFCFLLNVFLHLFLPSSLPLINCVEHLFCSFIRSSREDSSGWGTGREADDGLQSALSNCGKPCGNPGVPGSPLRLPRGALIQSIGDLQCGGCLSNSSLSSVWEMALLAESNAKAPTVPTASLAGSPERRHQLHTWPVSDTQTLLLQVDRLCGAGFIYIVPKLESFSSSSLWQTRLTLTSCLWKFRTFQFPSPS